MAHLEQDFTIRVAEAARDWKWKAASFTSIAMTQGTRRSWTLPVLVGQDGGALPPGVVPTYSLEEERCLPAGVYLLRLTSSTARDTYRVL